MASSSEVEKQEEESQPLKYKTKSSVLLRVSIHCEGCKRKVIKLLQSLPGVDDIQIERLQQRVVVTGDVKPETLITKLVKSGKNAQLWPPELLQESVMSRKDIPTKTEISAPDPSSTTVPSDGVTPPEGADKLPLDVKVEEKKPETGPPGITAAVVEKKEQQNENNGGIVVGGSGGGEGKKKKKKKGQNSNASGNTESEEDIGGGPKPTSIHSNQTLQRHQYPLPIRNYTPQPAPVYTMSYNKAHPPVSSFTTSYHAPSPPPPRSYACSHLPPPPNGTQPTQSSYGYSHFGFEMAPPQSVPLDYDSYTHSSSSIDSFEMFSDENPNGCSVM